MDANSVPLRKQAQRVLQGWRNPGDPPHPLPHKKGDLLAPTRGCFTNARVCLTNTRVCSISQCGPVAPPIERTCLFWPLHQKIVHVGPQRMNIDRACYCHSSIPPSLQATAEKTSVRAQHGMARRILGANQVPLHPYLLPTAYHLSSDPLGPVNCLLEVTSVRATWCSPLRGQSAGTITTAHLLPVSWSAGRFREVYTERISQLDTPHHRG